MAVQTSSRARSRRLRALLAGGLVLGLGAVVTLASWNASEYATGTFSASTFNLEGSLNGTTYSSHPVGSPATLAFTVPATNLAPGDVVYAPFAIRLAANTSRTAVVTITSPSQTGVLTGLTYALIQPTTFGCTSATTGTSLIASVAVGSAAGASTFALGIGTPTTLPGAPVDLCFVVTAGAGLVQAQTGSATWDFTAASV